MTDNTFDLSEVFDCIESDEVYFIETIPYVYPLFRITKEDTPDTEYVDIAPNGDGSAIFEHYTNDTAAEDITFTDKNTSDEAIDWIHNML